MKKYVFALFSMCMFMLTSCSTITRGSAYPKMYDESPTTILVMPPINNTNSVEAKDYYYTSLAKPLSEKGYYVVSPFLAMDILQSESAYDSEMFIDGNLSPFKDVFGADAALFTIINKWSKISIGGMISVEIEYILKSTITNEVLFNRKGVLNVDTSVSTGGNNAFLDLALTALNTALTDKVVAARRCNVYVLQDLPEGVYAPNHGNDKEQMAGGPILRGTVKK